MGTQASRTSPEVVTNGASRVIDAANRNWIDSDPNGLEALAKRAPVARGRKHGKFIIQDFDGDANQTMGVEQPLPHAAADNRAQSRKMRVATLIGAMKRQVRGHHVRNDEYLAIGSPDLICYTHTYGNDNLVTYGDQIRR